MPELAGKGAARWLPWLFFLLIFLFYTFPMGLSDFWWHLNSGRWIWQHQALFSVDPFTYSYAKDDDIRRVVISRAYYLGQLSYYFLYTWFGIWGLLLYKATLLTLPLFLLWRWLLGNGVEWRLVLCLLTPLPFLLYRFDELRPHIFSFIGVLLVLLQLEYMSQRLRRGQALAHYRWLLPLTTLLWANLHRGFIFGWVLLLVYGAYELWYWRRLAPTGDRRPLHIYLGVLAAAMAVSILNPNGVNALLANIDELNGPFMRVVDEYFPLYTYARTYQAPAIFYGALTLVLVCAGLGWHYRQHLQWRHGLLFMLFAYEGFATFRFSYFQALLLPALVAPALAAASAWPARHASRLLALALALALAVLIWGVSGRSALWHGPLETAYFPDRAAAFLRQHPPSGRLFNAFEYGGYLGWELYPQTPVFIDQRNLDFTVWTDYNAAWQGRYAEVFQRYTIDSVVFYARQPVLNRPPPLVLALLADPQWEAVYFDGISIILQRAADPALAPLDKDKIRAFLGS